MSGCRYEDRFRDGEEGVVGVEESLQASGTSFPARDSQPHHHNTRDLTTPPSSLQRYNFLLSHCPMAPRARILVRNEEGTFRLPRLF